jgi:hypothetical protein
MLPKPFRRKRLFVDPRVQGALVVRVVVYWFLCLLTVTLMLLCWRILTGPARMFYTHFDDMWFFYGPAAVASLLLLPVVVMDVLRLSNRFAGPMLRLRRGMRDLAHGQPVKPIEFRDGDFWQDFAQDFNAVLVRIQGSAIAEPPDADLPTSNPEEELVAAGPVSAEH